MEDLCYLKGCVKDMTFGLQLEVCVGFVTLQFANCFSIQISMIIYRNLLDFLKSHSDPKRSGRGF